MIYKTYVAEAGNAAELTEKLDAFFAANEGIEIVSTDQSYGSSILFTIIYKQPAEKRQVGGFTRRE